MPVEFKILYLLHDSRRSGVPAVAASFIREAAAVGVEPTVIFAYDGIYGEELRAAGVRVMTLGGRIPLLWRAYRFLMNWYLLTIGRQFDAVHVHSVKLAWSVLVASLLGIRTVFHLHELPRKTGWLLRSAMARADALVFCSETCAEHFAAVPARQRFTIVNAMKFSDQPVVRQETAPLKIVMVGSINRNKGQDLLLRAFAMMNNREAQLWLYGTTGLSAHKYLHDLKCFADSNGLSRRVFFPGPTADVFQVFAGAAVVVHTSWTESFGMALVEAMSCGAPVIAHDLEGMREVVTDGVCGFLIPPGDVAALASRLDKLLSDAALRSRLGGAGSALAREKFDIMSRLDEYLNLYRGIQPIKGTKGDVT